MQDLLPGRRPGTSKAEQVELKDQGEKASVAPRQRAPRASLVPIEQDFEAIDLETSFLEDSHHHRWLLTTCIAGIAATLLIGGVTLGIFGQNAVPNGANAAISENSVGGQLSRVLGSANVQTGSTGPAARGRRSAGNRWGFFGWRRDAATGLLSARQSDVGPGTCPGKERAGGIPRQSRHPGQDGHAPGPVAVGGGHWAGRESA